MKEFDEPIDISKDNSKLILSWVEFVKNVQPKSLERKGSQKKTGLMRLFSLKEDPLEIYLKKVLEANGLNFGQNKVPYFKFSITVNF